MEVMVAAVGAVDTVAAEVVERAGMRKEVQEVVVDLENLVVAGT